jgi:hypothetical protein
VPPAHRRHIERDLALGTAANDGPISAENEPRARQRPFDKLQECHDIDRPIGPLDVGSIESVRLN